nr:MAG TPA: hypothetical protein [Caudoviricetes sp.]
MFYIIEDCLHLFSLSFCYSLRKSYILFSLKRYCNIAYSP